MFNVHKDALIDLFHHDGFVGIDFGLLRLWADASSWFHQFGFLPRERERERERETNKQTKTERQTDITEDTMHIKGSQTHKQ